MEVKSLYKLDSKGKPRILNYWTEGALICQSSGLLGGALVENKKEAKPKNVGKANETSPEKQAVLEVESKIKEKMNEGYCETIEECNASTLVLPMLAKDFKKIKSIDWVNAWSQPKFDGQRMLAIKNGNVITLMSRGGKEILTLDHIKEVMISNNLADGIYDGEAYCKHLGGFQEQMKAIKKVGPNTTSIQYHIYDAVLPLPFEDRHNFLIEQVEALKNDTLKSVITTKVDNKRQLDQMHALNLQLGYEGTMVRISGKSYEVDSRSDQLLKYKDFQDVQLVIKDVVPQDSRPEQGQFIFEWLGAKGHFMGDDVLGCGMKFSHEERVEFLLNKHNYIGQKVELRFFEYSNEGVPRFPVAISIL
jgi:DNA ligase-1